MKNENNYASCANYAFFKGDSRGQKKLEFIQVYGKMYLQLNSFVTSLTLCAIEFMVSIPSIKF